MLAKSLFIILSISCLSQVCKAGSKNGQQPTVDKNQAMAGNDQRVTQRSNQQTFDYFQRHNVQDQQNNQKAEVIEAQRSKLLNPATKEFGFQNQRINPTVQLNKQLTSNPNRPRHDEIDPRMLKNQLFRPLERFDELDPEFFTSYFVKNDPTNEPGSVRQVPVQQQRSFVPKMIPNRIYNSNTFVSKDQPKTQDKPNTNDLANVLRSFKGNQSFHKLSHSKLFDTYTIFFQKLAYLIEQSQCPRELSDSLVYLIPILVQYSDNVVIKASKHEGYPDMIVYDKKIHQNLIQQFVQIAKVLKKIDHDKILETSRYLKRSIIDVFVILNELDTLAKSSDDFRVSERIIGKPEKSKYRSRTEGVAKTRFEISALKEKLIVKINEATSNVFDRKDRPRVQIGDDLVTLFQNLSAFLATSDSDTFVNNIKDVFIDAVKFSTSGVYKRKNNEGIDVSWFRYPMTEYNTLSRGIQSLATSFADSDKARKLVVHLQKLYSTLRNFKFDKEFAYFMMPYNKKETVELQQPARVERHVPSITNSMDDDRVRRVENIIKADTVSSLVSGTQSRVPDYLKADQNMLQIQIASTNSEIKNSSPKDTLIAREQQKGIIDKIENSKNKPQVVPLMIEPTQLTNTNENLSLIQQIEQTSQSPINKPINKEASLDLEYTSNIIDLSISLINTFESYLSANPGTPYNFDQLRLLIECFVQMVGAAEYEKSSSNKYNSAIKYTKKDFDSFRASVIMHSAIIESLRSTNAGDLSSIEMEETINSLIRNIHGVTVTRNYCTESIERSSKLTIDHKISALRSKPVMNHKPKPVVDNSVRGDRSTIKRQAFNSVPRNRDHQEIIQQLHDSGSSNLIIQDPSLEVKQQNTDQINLEAPQVIDQVQSQDSVQTGIISEHDLNEDQIVGNKWPSKVLLASKLFTADLGSYIIDNIYLKDLNLAFQTYLQSAADLRSGIKIKIIVKADEITVFIGYEPTKFVKFVDSLRGIRSSLAILNQNSPSDLLDKLIKQIDDLLTTTDQVTSYDNYYVETVKQEADGHGNPINFNDKVVDMGEIINDINILLPKTSFFIKLIDSVNKTRPTASRRDPNSLDDLLYFFLEILYQITKNANIPPAAIDEVAKALTSIDKFLDKTAELGNQDAQVYPREEMDEMVTTLDKLKGHLGTNLSDSIISGVNLDIISYISDYKNNLEPMQNSYFRRVQPNINDVSANIVNQEPSSLIVDEVQQIEPQVHDSQDNQSSLLNQTQIAHDLLEASPNRTIAQSYHSSPNRSIHQSYHESPDNSIYINQQESSNISFDQNQSESPRRSINQSQQQSPDRMIPQNQHLSPSRSIDQSQHHSPNRNINQSQHESVNITIDQSQHPSANRSIAQSQHPSSNRTIVQSQNDTLNRTNEQSQHQPIDRSVAQSQHEPLNRTIAQNQHVSPHRLSPSASQRSNTSFDSSSSEMPSFLMSELHSFASSNQLSDSNRNNTPRMPLILQTPVTPAQFNNNIQILPQMGSITSSDTSRNNNGYLEEPTEKKESASNYGFGLIAKETLSNKDDPKTNDKGEFEGIGNGMRASMNRFNQIRRSKNVGQPSSSYRNESPSNGVSQNDQTDQSFYDFLNSSRVKSSNSFYNNYDNSNFADQTLFNQSPGPNFMRSSFLPDRNVNNSFLTDFDFEGLMKNTDAIQNPADQFTPKILKDTQPIDTSRTNGFTQQSPRASQNKHLRKALKTRGLDLASQIRNFGDAFLDMVKNNRSQVELKSLRGLESISYFMFSTDYEDVEVNGKIIDSAAQLLTLTRKLIDSSGKTTKTQGSMFLTIFNYNRDLLTGISQISDQLLSYLSLVPESGEKRSIEEDLANLLILISELSVDAENQDVLYEIIDQQEIKLETGLVSHDTTFIDTNTYSVHHKKLIRILVIIEVVNCRTCTNYLSVSGFKHLIHNII